MSDLFGIPIYIAGDGSDTDTSASKDTEEPIKEGKPIVGKQQTAMPKFNPGKQYHREGGQSYAYQNSVTGLTFAANHHYDSVDGDYWLSSDLVPLNCHDNMPCRLFPGSPHRGGFTGQGSGYKISNHTAQQTMQSIRHKNGFYIRPARERFVQAAQRNLKYQMEVKGDADRWTLEVFAKIMQDALAVNCLVMIKCLDTVPGYKDCLARARKVGFQTRVINAATL